MKSTLKITSAMKLVASSKLRKAQRAIESLRPYERELQKILQASMPSVSMASLRANAELSVLCGQQTDEFESASNPSGTAVVAIASNSSLCGGFNSNVLRKVHEVLSEEKDVTVFSIGRKIADNLKKAGYPSPADYNDIAARAEYGKVQDLAQTLSSAFLDGTYSKIILVYNHFVSNSRQQVVAEQYLPFDSVKSDEDGVNDLAGYYLMEPGADAIVADLLPKVISLKLFASVLDSAAAEHAARTVAMQVATDNAQELLGDLTLEYNKGRQQKITAEILELVGGMQ